MLGDKKVESVGLDDFLSDSSGIHEILPHEQLIDFNSYHYYVDALVKNVDCINNLGEKQTSINSKTESIICYEIAKAAYNSCFCFYNGVVMAYDGKKYVPINKKNAENLFRAVMDRKNVSVMYQVNSPGKVYTHTERVLSVKEFHPNRKFISFNNLVVNMANGKTTIHDERIHSRFHMNYDYDKNAKCPQWMKFLTSVVKRADDIKTLQEFCGAMFIDRNEMKIEKSLFLIGTGSNGKGVFETIIRKVVGEGNYTTFSLQKLCTGNHYEQCIAEVEGKIVNICPDMGKGDFSNGGIFKSLVSNDVLQARFLYGKHFPTKELPLNISLMNEFPVSLDATDGHYRRILPVIFDVTFKEEEQDKMLAQKLEQELPGIFNWMMEGRRIVIQNKGRITEGESMRECLRKLRIDGNSILQYMEENRYVNEDNAHKKAVKLEISLKQLYDGYKAFIIESGKKHPYEKNNFATFLRTNLKFESKRKMDGMYFIMWQNPFDDDEDEDEEQSEYDNKEYIPIQKDIFEQDNSNLPF